jgi:hypothetical protein
MSRQGPQEKLERTEKYKGENYCKSCVCNPKRCNFLPRTIPYSVALFMLPLVKSIYTIERGRLTMKRQLHKLS